MLFKHKTMMGLSGLMVSLCALAFVGVASPVLAQSPNMGSELIKAGVPQIINRDVAHRGLWNSNQDPQPENSIEATQSAWAKGFDAVEIDIRMSGRDTSAPYNHPMVIHDKYANRTTTCDYSSGKYNAHDSLVKPYPASVAVTPVVTANIKRSEFTNCKLKNISVFGTVTPYADADGVETLLQFIKKVFVPNSKYSFGDKTLLVLDIQDPAALTQIETVMSRTDTTAFRNRVILKVWANAFTSATPQLKSYLWYVPEFNFLTVDGSNPQNPQTYKPYDRVPSGIDAKTLMRNLILSKRTSGMGFMDTDGGQAGTAPLTAPMELYNYYISLRSNSSYGPYMGPTMGVRRLPDAYVQNARPGSNACRFFKYSGDEPKVSEYKYDIENSAGWAFASKMDYRVTDILYYNGKAFNTYSGVNATCITAKPW